MNGVESRAVACVARLCFWLVLCGTGATVSVASADDVAEFIKLLPAETNAAATVRVADILSTPRATRENWAQAADEQFLNSGGIPSWVKTLVVGYLIRSNGPEEVWSAAVASVPESETVESFASRYQRPIELLGNTPAVVGRHDSYILQLAAGRLGIRSPAVRQEAAQWAQSIATGRSGPLSTYLVQAIQQSGHLVLAIDLDHALDPTRVQRHLEADPAYAKTPEAVTQLVSLIGSLRGLTCSVMLGETHEAVLRIDFSQPVGKLTAQTKQFFIEALQQTGAMIDEFETSTATTEGNSLVLKTPLSDESVRRIMSLITSAPNGSTAPDRAAAQAEIPPVPKTTPPVSAPPVTATTPPRPATAAARPQPSPSRRYLNSVNGILDDLTRALRRARNYEKTAQWHENFARRIDALPTDGVDPELVTYGGRISTWLRALSRSLRGEGMIVNMHEGSIVFNQQFDPGWASFNIWGGVGFQQPSFQVTSNLQEVRQRQAEAVAAGLQQRDEIWQLIEKERASIDQRMRQKYGSNF